MRCLLISLASASLVLVPCLASTEVISPQPAPQAVPLNIAPKNTLRFFPGIPPKPFLPVVNPGCKGFSILSPNIRPYLEGQSRQILERWNTVPNYRNKKPILELRILPSGELQHLAVRISSGDPQTDQASLDAVQKAFPFHPTDVQMPSRAYTQVLSFPDLQAAVNSHAPQKDLPKPQAGEWVNQLQIRARKNWKPPSSQTTRRVDVIAFIHVKTGEILSQDIALNSCDPEMDEAALSAIAKLKTVSPPRFVHDREIIKVLMTFDYQTPPLFFGKQSPTKP